jgi:hypothetical protein
VPSIGLFRGGGHRDRPAEGLDLPARSRAQLEALKFHRMRSEK